MDNNVEKSSVREEQFGEEINNPENTVKKEEPSDRVKDVQKVEDADSELINSDEITEKEVKKEEYPNKAEVINPGKRKL